MRSPIEHQDSGIFQDKRKCIEDDALFSNIQFEITFTNREKYKNVHGIFFDESDR